MNKRGVATAVVALLFASGLSFAALHPQRDTKPVRSGSAAWKPQIVRSEQEWRKRLTPEQFAVLREKDTERPFTGKYNHFTEKGTFVCAACGNPLFRSDTKFDSGTGWPSFWTPISKQSVHTETDTSLGEVRTEVLCNRCGGHLGHVFDDGPQPTGLRYCMNSVALQFKKKP